MAYLERIIFEGINKIKKNLASLEANFIANSFVDAL